jgi:hypothetical protein
VKLRNVVRRSYLAKVNPITINFDKVKMEIKRKIELIKSYRSKNGNVKFRLKNSNYETLSSNKNGGGDSKPYYSFFEEQEKLNKNKYREDLKEKNYDEELLSQKESEYFEDESEDDYEERVKNYYKNKKVSSLSKYKNDKDDSDDSDGDVEIYGNKFRRKISDKILNKYNRKKELYNDDLDEYSEQNYDDDLENEDRIVRKKSNNKTVKNQRIRYLEEDEDFLDNRGDEIDRYKYSPAIINIKNIYPVRGGCGEKINMVKKILLENQELNSINLKKIQNLMRQISQGRIDSKINIKMKIEELKNLNLEILKKKRNGEDSERESTRRRRDREDYYRQELSEEDDELFETKRQSKNCGKTIVSINVASKNGVSVEFDKKNRRRYEESEE